MKATSRTPGVGARSEKVRPEEHQRTFQHPRCQHDTRHDNTTLPERLLLPKRFPTVPDLPSAEGLTSKCCHRMRGSSTRLCTTKSAPEHRPNLLDLVNGQGPPLPGPLNFEICFEHLVLAITCHYTLIASHLFALQNVCGLHLRVLLTRQPPCQRRYPWHWK